jgi:peptidoglycan/LPS O-acetylase OafA/YrhL
LRWLTPGHVEELQVGAQPQSAHGSFRYRAELNGIRAVAVLAVFASHVGFDRMVGGWIGVGMFLVLSGYLITSILMAECAVLSAGLIMGIYLFHLPALELTARYGPGPWAVNVALALGLTLAMTAASYRLLEQPLLRLKSRAPITTSLRGREAFAPPPRGVTTVGEAV